MPSKTFAVNFETGGFRRASSRMADIASDAEDAGDSLDDAAEGASDAGDEMDSAGSSATSFGSNLQTAGRVGGAAVAAVATAVTGAVAGIGKLASETAKYAQKVDRASEQSGVAAEEIQEIAYAAQQTSGVEFDAVRDGLKELALRSEEAAMGTGEAKEAFDKLGISQKFLKSNDTSAIFKRVRQELQGASKQTRIFASEMLLGGEAGQKMVEVLGLSNEEMAKMRKEAQKSGKVLSSQQVAALESAQQAWTRLTSSVSGFGRQIAANLAPVLTGTVIPALRSTVQFIRDASRVAMNEGASGFQAFWRTTKRVANAILSIWASFRDSIMKIWDAWGGYITERAEGVFQNLVSAFHGLAGIIQGVWDTLVGVLVGNWGRAWEGIKGIVTNAALTIAQAITGLVESVLSGLSALSSYVPGVGDEISGAIDSARQSVERFRKSILDAQKDASGLSSVWNGFSGGDFGGGGAGGLFGSTSTSSSTRGSTPTVGGDSAPGSISPNASGGSSVSKLVQDLWESVKGLDKVKKKMTLMKKAGKRATSAVSSGFKTIDRSLQSAVSNLMQGKDAALDFGKMMRKVFADIIAKLSAMIVKLTVVASIKAAAGISSGGITSIGGALTKVFTKLADGGLVTGPTLAMVGEGGEDEAVLPLSRLESMLSIPQATPQMPAAIAGSGGLAVDVHVEGETRTSGRDLVTSYDTSKRAQARRGHK